MRSVDVFPLINLGSESVEKTPHTIFNCYMGRLGNGLYFNISPLQRCGSMICNINGDMGQKSQYPGSHLQVDFFLHFRLLFYKTAISALY